MSAATHKATPRIYLKRKAIASIPAITPIGSKEPVSATLPRAVRRIARELRPDKIILFGSYAYGQPNGDSDVDLLVIMQTEEKSALKRFVMVGSVLIPREFAVDILVRTPDELEALMTRKHFFYSEIVSKGKVLYERKR